MRLRPRSACGRGQPWAAGVVVLLGVSIAATWLVEGFVLGIVAYLHALLVAVLAIVVALVIAAYVKNGSNKSDWRAHGGDRGTDLADR